MRHLFDPLLDFRILQGKAFDELDEGKEKSRGWHCGIRGLLKGWSLATVELLHGLAVNARVAAIERGECSDFSDYDEDGSEDELGSDDDDV